MLTSVGPSKGKHISVIWTKTLNHLSVLVHDMLHWVFLTQTKIQKQCVENRVPPHCIHRDNQYTWLVRQWEHLHEVCWSIQVLPQRQGGKTSNDLRERVWRPISLGNHRPTERKTSPWKTWRTAATRLRRDIPARSCSVHTSCNISFRLYVPTVQQMWCLHCSHVGDAVICSDWHIQSKPLHTCFLKVCPPTGSYTAVTKGTVISRVRRDELCQTLHISAAFVTVVYACSDHTDCSD